jgi:hypothetical protein
MLIIHKLFKNVSYLCAVFLIKRTFSLYGRPQNALNIQKTEITVQTVTEVVMLLTTI